MAEIVDHFDQAEVLLNNPEDLEPADAGKADVQEDEIDVFLVENGKRGFARCHAQDPVFPLQDGGQRVPHALVVVDDENGLRFVGHPAADGWPVLSQAVDTVASRSLRYAFCSTCR